MKLPFICSDCTFEITNPKEYEEHINYVNVKDSKIYELECKKGHKNVMVINHLNHEVLFEIGVQALFDGYYREAFSSFAAALERFYEFYIQVGMEVMDVSLEEFDKCWKDVSTSSERQLGAYLFVYLLLNKKKPEVLKDKFRAKRNNVIHKGEIPNYEQAIEYGEQVYNEIMQVLTELKYNYENEMISVSNKFIFNNLNRARENFGEYNLRTVDFPFVLNWRRLELQKNGISKFTDRILDRPKCFSVLNCHEVK